MVLWESANPSIRAGGVHPHADSRTRVPNPREAARALRQRADVRTEHGSSQGQNLACLFIFRDMSYVHTGGIHPQAHSRTSFPDTGLAARALRQRAVHRRLFFERRTHLRWGTSSLLLSSLELSDTKVHEP